MRLCIFTITFILPCLSTFWHAVPTSLFWFFFQVIISACACTHTCRSIKRGDRLQSLAATISKNERMSSCMKRSYFREALLPSFDLNQSVFLPMVTPVQLMNLGQKMSCAVGDLAYHLGQLFFRKMFIHCSYTLEGKIYSRISDRRLQRSKHGSNCARLSQQQDMLALG